MANNSGYKTGNRTKILDYLMSQQDHTVSVNDIHIFLESNNTQANISTIYRYLNQLCDDGIVIKYVAEKGEKARFQYVENGQHCHEHLHMQCSKCGKVMHLDCSFMQEIEKHLQTEHGLWLECAKSVLYGTCKDCKEQEHDDSKK